MSANDDVPWTDLSDAERGIDSAILLRARDVPENTRRQMQAMSARPDVKHARFMADCHPVTHAMVGQTSQLTDKVDPATVGGDIGCGISAYLAGVATSKMRLERLKTQIEARVPRGPSTIFPAGQAYATTTDLEAMLEAYGRALELLCANYLDRFGIDIRAHVPVPTPDQLTLEWFRERCAILKQNTDEAVRSLGTLGAGNHYIEISRDSRNQIWVVVHTGSRGPGQAAFRFHRNVILRGQDFDRTGHLKAQRRIEKQFPGKNSVERRDALEQLRLEQLAALHPPYLEGAEAYAYYLDLLLMQTYARWNRKLITRHIVTAVLGCAYADPDTEEDNSRFVESVHNLIDFDDFHVRKGAIAAYTHRRAIVSINMAQGCWIVRALRDNPDTNFSAPHGLGRNEERGAVPAGSGSLRDRLYQFRQQMGDIVADVNQHTLDEAPASYKSPELVCESLKHHVTIEDQLFPLINIKG